MEKRWPCVAHSNTKLGEPRTRFDRAPNTYLGSNGRGGEHWLLAVIQVSLPGRWKRDIPKLRTMKPFTEVLRYRWLRAVSEGLVSNMWTATGLQIDAPSYPPL